MAKPATTDPLAQCRKILSAYRDNAITLNAYTNPTSRDKKLHALLDETKGKIKVAVAGLMHGDSSTLAHSISHATEVIDNFERFCGSLRGSTVDTKLMTTLTTNLEELYKRFPAREEDKKIIVGILHSIYADNIAKGVTQEAIIGSPTMGSPKSIVRGGGKAPEAFSLTGDGEHSKDVGGAAGGAGSR